MTAGGISDNYTVIDSQPVPSYVLIVNTISCICINIVLTGVLSIMQCCTVMFVFWTVLCIYILFCAVLCAGIFPSSRICVDALKCSWALCWYAMLYSVLWSVLVWYTVLCTVLCVGMLYYILYYVLCLYAILYYPQCWYAILSFILCSVCILILYYPQCLYAILDSVLCSVLECYTVLCTIICVGI